MAQEVSKPPPRRIRGEHALFVRGEGGRKEKRKGRKEKEKKGGESFRIQKERMADI
jgi:hypothetical protein